MSFMDFLLIMSLPIVLVLSLLLYGLYGPEPVVVPAAPYWEFMGSDNYKSWNPPTAREFSDSFASKKFSARNLSDAEDVCFR